MSGQEMNIPLKIEITAILLLSCACQDFDSSSLEHDGVACEEGPAGSDGKDGADGQDGVDGRDGADGGDGRPGSAAALYDQDDRLIGYFLERVDFNDNTFEIMTVESLRTVVDLDDASFSPPAQLGGVGISCVYEANDCSGTCFGVDERARGYILNGQDGQFFAVAPDAPTVAIVSDSHNEVATLGTCSVQNGNVPTAVEAEPYDGVLAETLAVPLVFRVPE